MKIPIQFKNPGYRANDVTRIFFKSMNAQGRALFAEEGNPREESFGQCFAKESFLADLRVL